MNLQAWSMASRCLAGGAAVAAFVSTAAIADTLSPIVRGSVYETGPFDGTPDSTDTIPFIGAGNQFRHRAIFEFDLTGVPLGAVQSASLTGRVAANNHFDTGTRTHIVDVFSGDGNLTLEDYDIAGMNVGSFSHPSGQNSNFNLNVSSALQNLLNGGASHFGVRISSGTNPQGYDVVDDSSVPFALTFSLMPANTTLQNLFPAVDAQGQRPAGGLATVSDSGNSFTIRRTATSSTDSRAVLEFDIRSIPDNADIVSASITMQIFSFTQGGGQFPQPLFYGYMGDGMATPADLEQTTNLLGTADPITSGGIFSAALDPAYIESLLSTSDYLGLLGVGTPNGQSVQLWTWEARSFATPPFLSLTYAVPPVPGDYNRNGHVGLEDYSLWRSTFGATMGGDLRADGNRNGTVDAADYVLWRKAPSTGSGSIAKVPEPNSIVILLYAGVLLIILFAPRSARTI